MLGDFYKIIKTSSPKVRERRVTLYTVVEVELAQGFSPPSRRARQGFPLEGARDPWRTLKLAP